MTASRSSVEHPHMEQYSDAPTYNTKAVVQQTGVAAPTLRAWERRYALLSPQRANNTYRLYSQRDIMLIRWLKSRINEGMAISKAISLFRYFNSHQDEEQSGSLADETAGFHVALQKTSQSVTEDIGPLLHRGDTPSLRAFPPLHNMQMVREQLLEVFSLFDEPAAQTLISSMLAIYSVERVCTELITPTMWQIGQRWAEGRLTITVEHFASNFFRALLTNLLHLTFDSPTSPLVLVGSAPGEPHELASLMLALFLRRRGLRVAYLGQSIETTDLLDTIEKFTPGLICVSLTLTTYLSELINLGKHVMELPSPRPIFAFGGQAFLHHPNIIEQVPGLYLNGELLTATEQLKNMLLSMP